MLALIAPILGFVYALIAEKFIKKRWIEILIYVIIVTQVLTIPTCFPILFIGLLISGLDFVSSLLGSLFTNLGSSLVLVLLTTPAYLVKRLTKKHIIAIITIVVTYIGFAVWLFL